MAPIWHELMQLGRLHLGTSLGYGPIAVDQ